jgi:hypothetical protein
MENKLCNTHGLTKFNFIGQGKNKRLRCAKCNVERVTQRRQKVKEQLVFAKGGKCICCGYNKYVGALAFHHIDESTKSFGISEKGNTRSFERQLKELEKCVLFCLNCHAENHYNSSGSNPNSVATE